MTKIKFFHPLTGKIVTMKVGGGIMKNGSQKSVVSINKVCNHMWAQGYVRAGKNVVLTDFEKKAIEMAPVYIKQLKAEIEKHESKGEVITGIVDCMKGDFTQPERPAIPLAFSAPETPKAEPSIADRLNALRR